MLSAGRRVIKCEEVRYLDAAFRRSGLVRQNRTDPDGSADPGRSASGECPEARLKNLELKAYETGWAEGRKCGVELRQAEAVEAVETISAILKDLACSRRNILERCENEIIQLSLDIARKVIHLEVTTRPDIIRQVLKDAIANLVNRESLKIRMNPEDFRLMTGIKSDFLSQFDDLGTVVFEEDPAVGRGGAIVETLCGEVDARIDQQFRMIEGLLQTAPRAAAAPSAPSDGSANHDD